MRVLKTKYFLVEGVEGCDGTAMLHLASRCEDLVSSPDAMYINPILHIHSTFQAAKEFYDSFGPDFSWSGKEAAGIGEVLQGKRNLVVGEPGIGKTELLKHIQVRLNENGLTTSLIALRDKNATAQIDDFLTNNPSTNRALLLDGIDEVQASLFPLVLEKLREVSDAHSDLQLVSKMVIFCQSQPSGLARLARMPEKSRLRGP